jgi:hypothetical protein
MVRSASVENDLSLYRDLELTATVIPDLGVGFGQQELESVLQDSDRFESVKVEVSLDIDVYW